MVSTTMASKSIFTSTPSWIDLPLAAPWRRRRVRQQRDFLRRRFEATDHGVRKEPTEQSGGVTFKGTHVEDGSNLVALGSQELRPAAAL
jgi:hypothetical protein